MPNQTSSVYGLIDGDTMELRYVGQTRNNLSRRLRQHKAGYTTNTHLTRWLASCNSNIIVLETTPLSLINEAEILWIADMQKLGANLINIADGGYLGPGVPGRLGKINSPEHRAKTSAALKGRPKTPVHVAAVTAANKNSTKMQKYLHSSELQERLARMSKPAAEKRWRNV